MLNTVSATNFVAPLVDAIVAQAQETVIITDGDVDLRLGPTIQFVNEAAMQSSGYASQELIGKRLACLYADDVMSRVVESLLGAARRRAPVIAELPTQTQSGSQCWLEISTIPIFAGNGALRHFARIGRDISARKQAEQQREITQRLLASVFGVINQPLAVADENGNVMMANNALTRQLGWSIFELMGKPIENILSAPDRPHLSKLMACGDALDQTRHARCLMQHKSEGERTGEIELTTLLQVDGKHYHVLTLRPEQKPQAAEEAWARELSLRDAMRGGLSGGAVVAGKLQLVGLDVVRQALGERWPAMAERAYSLAERTIQRHLRPGDIFRKSADDGYLVLFAQLSETEAQFKARAIADEIREKLTGAFPELVEAKVTAFAGSVALEAPDGTSDEEIMVAIERRLREGRSRVEAAANATLRSGLRAMDVVTAGARNAAGQVAPITFVRLPEPLQSAIDTLRSLGHSPYEVETEAFLLAGAAQRVLGGLTRSPGELIMAPVRLSTLSQHRSCEAWLSVARTLGDAAKRQIVAEIRDVPADVAQTRLGDLVMRLSALFKSVAFELPGSDPAFLALLPPQCRLVTMAYSGVTWSGDTRTSVNFQRLVHLLEVRQRRLILRNCPPHRIPRLAKAGVSLFVTEAQAVERADQA